MANVSAEETILLFGSGVEGSVAEPRCLLVVVVVAPFGKVVRKLEAGGVCVCVFKVNDDKLFVGVGGQEKRRCARWQKTEDVTVLSLRGVRWVKRAGDKDNLHRCEQRHSESAADRAQCTVLPATRGISAPSS